MLESLCFDLNIKGLTGMPRNVITDKTSLCAMFLLNYQAIDHNR